MSAAIDHVEMIKAAGFSPARAVQPLGNPVKIGSLTETACQNHSRIADLLDGTSELRDAYRRTWLEEYFPCSIGTVLGR